MLYRTEVSSPVLEDSYFLGFSTGGSIYVVMHLEWVLLSMFCHNSHLSLVFTLAASGPRSGTCVLRGI